MQRLAAAHGADFRIFYPHNEVDLARKNISCIKDEAENIAVAPKRLFLQRVAKWPQTPFGWSTILQAWSKGDTHEQGGSPLPSLSRLWPPLDQRARPTFP